MSRRFTITRRGLFRGIGTATLVAGCGPRGRTDTQAADGAQALGRIGPDEAPLQLTLNGEPVSTFAQPRTTLLSLLRDDLGVTGPKQVCNRGACGACMVLVDGIPRNGCMTLAHDVAGAEITTVEGLAKGGTLTPLQDAFVRHDAMQCGFCTSGMLVTGAALLRRHAGKTGGLTAADVKRAISGNLCRCGSYTHVVAAVLDVARRGGGA